MRVVLVHGAWADGSCWAGVIRRLQAAGHDVIAPQMPHTSLADDVDRLRHVLGMDAVPTVLAGHSFGGLYILTFAATYPDQVAGMVLLDSTAPAPGPVPPAKAGSYDLVGRISALFPALAHLGAAHLIADSYDSLPQRSRRALP